MWGVIPVHVRRNKQLSDKAKLLYAEITDFTDENGVCVTSNNDFAKYLSVSPTTARRYLYELRDMELICIDGDGSDRRITFPEKMVLVEAKEKPKQAKLKTELTHRVVDIWNTHVVTRGIKPTPGLIQTVTARSKNFTDDQILEAVTNRAKFVNSSEWHNKPENVHHKKNIYLCLRTDKDLERSLYLDTQTSQQEGENIITTRRF